MLCLQVIASCGYWDNSIRCYSSEEGRLLQSIRQHKDIVTCIEAGSDGCTLATGATLTLPPAYPLIVYHCTPHLHHSQSLPAHCPGAAVTVATPKGLYVLQDGLRFDFECEASSSFGQACRKPVAPL